MIMEVFPEKFRVTVPTTPRKRGHPEKFRKTTRFSWNNTLWRGCPEIEPAETVSP
jgi:hypothetical protein